MDVRRCPVCRSPWRAQAMCPRCGADLAPLMRLSVRAWTLREAACASLLAGGIAEGVAMARAAYAFERTPRARRLLALALIVGGNAGARALIAEAAATE